jgi:hypothetical protein
MTSNAWRPVILSDWQFWRQLSDPAADGDPGSGPNAGLDCGPESVAMCLEHITGIAGVPRSGICLDADYVWDVMQTMRRRRGEPTGIGYTTVADQERAFPYLCSTKTAVHMVDETQQYQAANGTVNAAPRDLFWHIWQALIKGHPLIGLFSYTAPNSPDGHFRAIYGISPDTIFTADPIAGDRPQNYADFWAWSKGTVTEVLRSRHA